MTPIFTFIGVTSRINVYSMIFFTGSLNADLWFLLSKFNNQKR